MLRSLLVALAALVLFLPVTSCRSRCSADVDCFKACQCNGSTDWCSVGLLCENTFCEGEEAIPCGVPGDTFCEKYGNSCGQKRCESSNECRRKCECSVTVGTGMAQRNCCIRKTLQSECERGTRLCSRDFARSCDEICLNDLDIDPNTCQAQDKNTLEAWTTFSCPAPVGPQQPSQ